jgi:hypothetical protein
MSFAPAPVELEANKPHALWAFAIAVVRFNIRRRSWAFFREWWDNRRQFIELYVRNDGSTTFGVPPTYSELEELSRLKKTLTTADRLALNGPFQLFSLIL